MAQPLSRDTTQVALGLVLLTGLVVTSYLVLLPFLGAFIWAGMIVVATWPGMLRLQNLFLGKRWLAVTVLTVALLIVLIIPLWVAISGVVGNADNISHFVKDLGSEGIPPPPSGLEKIPVIGPKLVAKWLDIASKDKEQLAGVIAPYVGQSIKWFVSKVGSLGLLFVNFLLTVAFAALLYMSGETVAGGFKRFAQRLAGDRGEGLVVLSGQAIRAVALGIVVTALVQAVMALIGFALAGIAYPLFLTTLIFLLCVIQLGAWIVLFPVVGWLFYSGASVTATLMLIWSLIIVGIDNILRPLLIKKGADLPLLLIIVGVIGGLLAFGILGLFVGPVVLAVGYTLLRAWVNASDDFIKS